MTAMTSLDHEFIGTLERSPEPGGVATRPRLTVNVAEATRSIRTHGCFPTNA